MMKTWLESLKGMALNEAKALVEGKSLKCNVLPKGSMRIALAVANTVFLYADGDVIDHAESGDGAE